MFVFWAADYFIDIIVTGSKLLLNMEYQDIQEEDIDGTVLDRDLLQNDEIGDLDPDLQPVVAPDRELTNTSSTQNTQNTDYSNQANIGDKFVEQLENFIVKASLTLCSAHFLIFYILPSPMLCLLFVDTLYLSSLCMTKIKV